MDAQGGPTEMRERRVVITGYGMITPLGRNTEETFDSACRGDSGIAYITSFDTHGLPCRIGGQVDDAWLDGLEDPRVRRFENLASRGLRLMAVATAEAAGQARLEEVDDRETIGISLGSHGENPSVEDMRFLHRFYEGEGRWDLKGLMQTGGYPYSKFFRRKADVAMALLAGLFGCRGPNLSIVSACAAGAQAIGEATQMIREGKARVMIAGGSEATLDFLGLVGFRSEERR